MRISDWSSDVCSSDLHAFQPQGLQIRADHPAHEQRAVVPTVFRPMNASIEPQRQAIDRRGAFAGIAVRSAVALLARRRLGMEGGTRLADPSSEESRAGKACVRTCKSRWTTDHLKKKQ